ncbi:hypothetical protein LA080_009992 [Diaporthe eres]|nr:hypothetical protein LA080_009992 [Diaporthe eres]
MSSQDLDIDELQSHIVTSDHAGRPFTIVFMARSTDYDEIYQDLQCHIEVMKGFVTAWNRGDLDVTGRPPIATCQPLDYLVVMGGHHLSSYSPTERRHITVKVSSNALWNLEPRETKGVVHIYSRNDDTRYGYDAYRLHDHKRTTRYKAGSKYRAAMDKAMSRRAPTAAWLKKQNTSSQSGQNQATSQPLPGNSGPDNAGQQASSNGPAGKLSDGTPCYWSSTSRAYYRYDRKGKPVSVKATDVHLARRAAPAPAPRPSTNRGRGSVPNKKPEGHLKDGTPYYYSTSQHKFYTIGSDGSRRLLSTR